MLVLASTDVNEVSLLYREWVCIREGFFNLPLKVVCHPDMRNGLSDSSQKGEDLAVFNNVMADQVIEYKLFKMVVLNSCPSYLECLG